MQKDFYKYISFSIIFFLIIIPNTKSEEEINQGGNDRRDDDDRHPDFMKILIDLKEEIQKELSMKNGEDSMMGHLLSNMNIITEDMVNKSLDQVEKIVETFSHKPGS